MPLPLKQGLSLNLELMFSGLKWKPKSHSNSHVFVLHPRVGVTGINTLLDKQGQNLSSGSRDYTASTLTLLPNSFTDFFFCMFVWNVCTYMHLCVCGCTQVHVMQRSKVDHFQPYSLSQSIISLSREPAFSRIPSVLSGHEVESRLLYSLGVYLDSGTKFMMLSPLVWMEGKRQ